MDFLQTWYVHSIDTVEVCFKIVNGQIVIFDWVICPQYIHILLTGQ